MSTHALNRMWGQAETEGIKFGVAYAGRTTDFGSKKEEFMAWAIKNVTDLYRWSMRTGGVRIDVRITIPIPGFLPGPSQVSFGFGTHVPNPRHDDWWVQRVASTLEGAISTVCTVPIPFRSVWACRWHP